MIRRRTFLGAALLPLLSAAGLQACAEEAGAASGRTGFGRFVALADGVHVRQAPVELMTAENHGGIANIGFVVGEAGVAMIDSGGSAADGRHALAAIRAVTDRPVLYLVNTHMHPDHVFGNAVFKEAGAEIVGHANLPAALGARAETYKATMRAEIGDALMADVGIVLPDTVVEDVLSLDLGGRTLRLKAWATAHTDNDLTVYDEASGTLFCGDLVFLEHVPIIDGSLKGWLAQLPALAAIPAIRAVPGHGPASAPWPAALEAERVYFEALAADIRRAIADGATLGEATESAGQSQKDLWRLFDDYHPRNAAAAFAELEWE